MTNDEIAFIDHCMTYFRLHPDAINNVSGLDLYRTWQAAKQPATEQPVQKSPMELLKLLGHINAMIGYCQSLRVGTVITDGYMQRMNDHYIPSTKKACMLIAEMVDMAQASKSPIENQRYVVAGMSVWPYGEREWKNPLFTCATVEDAHTAKNMIHDALKRESGYPAGMLLKSNDPDFPVWLVAVPLEQMKDIKSRLKTLIGLGQTHYKAFDTQSKEVSELKSAVFGEAEMACMMAGNWTQQEPPTTEIEDGATK